MVVVSSTYHSRMLSESLWTQAKNGVFTDTSFYFGASEFKVHSCVMNFAAPEFLKQWTTVGKDDEIDISLFEKILMFFYIGEISISDSEIEQMYSFGKKYGLDVFVDSLKEHLNKMDDTAARPTVNNSTEPQECAQLSEFSQLQRDIVTDAVTVVVEAAEVECLTSVNEDQSHAERNGTEAITTQSSRRQQFHECRVCGKKFQLILKLYDHYIKAKHLTHEVPHKCEVCDRYFSSKRDLNAHNRNHNLEKPYQCGECDKTYGSKTGLKHHISTVHLKVKHTCVECGKSFSQASHLAEHTRIHTKERRHVCSYCGHSLASKNGLRRHESGHSGIHKLRCMECGKGFTTKYDLKRHITRMHKRDQSNS